MVSSSALFASCTLLASCTTVPGECDPELARRVVYSDEGFPAYEGQALLFTSCGYGTFCHGSSALANLRRGAPSGYDLDIDPASYDDSPGDLERLQRVQRFAFNNRNAIWEQVITGAMPPGDEGSAVLESPLRPRYARQEGSDRLPLPEIRTAEGREILRNWLACGTPVIERTEDRMDGVGPTVGVTVRLGCDDQTDCSFTSASRCDVAMNTCVGCLEDGDCSHLEETPLCSAGRCVQAVEPTWASIHAVIIETTCALALCHGNPEGNHEAALDLRGRDASYVRVMMASVTEECGSLGLALVRPNEPDNSLLYRKLIAVDDEDTAVCGRRMPYDAGSPLPDQWIQAIQRWIADGAEGP